MKSKSMMLMVLSMGFGLIAAIGISQVMGRSSSAPPAMKMGSVLVAADHLDIYANLTEENVKIENWPANIIPEDALTSLEDVTDKIVLSRLSKGMPIVGSVCVTEKEHLSSKLKIPEGFKVVAIKVAGDDTISGLLNPGDKVDVIGFFKKRGAAGQTQTTSKTFLKALRVWSVDGSLQANREEGGNGSGTAIVGVLVNEKQSEDIYFAQKTGEIKLVLRGDYVEGDENVEDLADLMGWDEEKKNEMEEELEEEPKFITTEIAPQPKQRMVIWERGSPREITFAPNELPREGGSMEDDYPEDDFGDGDEGVDDVDSGSSTRSGSPVNTGRSRKSNGSGSGNRNSQRYQ